MIGAMGRCSFITMVRSRITLPEGFGACFGNGSNSFLVTGFNSAGSCPLNDGLIALALQATDEGRSQLAILLAAKLADMPVSVRVDDSNRNGFGTCYLWLIEFQ